jgi:beta-galactosidase
VAVIYDYENRWAVDDAKGPRNGPEDFYGNKQYPQTCIEHFRPFWNNGVSCDVIDTEMDLGKYKLVIAPVLYMLNPGVAEKIERFVAGGGTFVTTYFSGIVNETDLAFLTGFPGPLRKVMGIWSEETDALYDDEHVLVTAVDKSASVPLRGPYKGGFLCDIIHPEGAEVIATYASEFYAGTPAVTVNRFGKGRAYYLATRFGEDFNDDFYGGLIDDLKLHRNLGTRLPQGVTAQRRTDGDREFVFVLSFVKQSHEIDLGERTYTDALSGERITGKLSLPGYGYRVLERVADRDVA